MQVQPDTTKESSFPELKGNGQDLLESSRPSSRDSPVPGDGYGSSDEHIFSEPAVADHWRNVFEKARYENRHRFDPNYRSVIS